VTTTAGLCRDCGVRLAPATEARCPACGSPRLLRHRELFDLAIAHIDCDAFFAAVEKRDDPALLDKPVIVGGGRRGVVSTACYIARLYGVGSAMPMFRALERCPDAVVLRPDMRKYQEVGQAVRALMAETTPRLQPLSIDEAFLDFSHGPEAPSPAERLVGLARRIEDEIGITVSIGLSYNKFLAKLASDLDKPRGFSVVGRAEARDFLAPLAVRRIWGVGPALAQRLQRDGISRIGQLQDRDEAELVRRYGSIGRRLARFAVGEDERRVEPGGAAKSVSVETTLESDLAEAAGLEEVLRGLCERLAERLRRRALAGQTVVLKLKTGDFRLRTRSATLAAPTGRAEVLFRAARSLLAREADGTRFRLIGIGLSKLAGAADADPPDMLDAAAARRRAP
jgi:DNA polymerase-4